MITEPSYWSTITGKQYDKMQARHRVLWEYVYGYLQLHNVRRVLEIGGGTHPLAQRWVLKYENIDLNRQADAVHDDFTTMDVYPWRGVDMVLAAGVIEHQIDGFVPFLDRVLAVRPRHALISFFMGLPEKPATVREDQRGFVVHTYCRSDITKWLGQQRVKYHWEDLGKRDVILILRGAE